MKSTIWTALFVSASAFAQTQTQIIRDLSNGPIVQQIASNFMMDSKGKSVPGSVVDANLLDLGAFSKKSLFTFTVKNSQYSQCFFSLVDKANPIALNITSCEELEAIIGHAQSEETGSFD